MPVSRGFFAAILAGFLVISGLYFATLCLQIGVPTDDSYWTHEVVRRKLQVAAGMQEPKLLLVGGSATFFGVSACQIEEELGIPAVNMATHATLGPHYMLELVKTVVRPGDVVVLIFEYDLYERSALNTTKWAGEDFISYMMARDPAYLRHLPLHHQIRFGFATSFQRLRAGLQGRFSPQPPPACDKWGFYDPNRINNHGDLTGHTDTSLNPPNPRGFRLPEALGRGLSRKPAGFPVLAQFAQWAKEHDVQVLAAYPNIARIPGTDAPLSQQALARICQFYRSIGVPNVETPQDAILPRTDFLDTHYHLNEQAARARTHRLCFGLRKYLDQPVARGLDVAPGEGN